MSELHPIMAQALAPFMPPKARTYKAPRAEHGIYVFEWDTDCDEPIVCHLEYSPACKGAWERGGVQIEPDEPASISLGAAYLLDVDILYLLDEKQIERIETLALADMVERANDYGD